MRAAETCSSNSLTQFRILGIPVSAIDLSRAANLVNEWSAVLEPRMVFVREVPSLMNAVDEPRLGALHDQADLVVPDGTPLVWVGRMRGLGSNIGRVAGADLVGAVCAKAEATGRRLFFYGGRPGVAEQMAQRLKARFPNIVVAGVLSPPMRDIGPDFVMDEGGRAEIELIRAASPDIIWVGLSSPKQEYWMAQAAPLLGCGVFVGVGAAFDFHAGVKRRAPRWMCENGLEWLHRLLSEPRRLWRRYLVHAPRFVLSVILEEKKQRVNNKQPRTGAVRTEYFK